MEKVNEAASFRAVNISTTTTLKGYGSILGINVASSSSGTIKLQDGSKTILNTRDLTAGEFITFPTGLDGDLVVTLGGTADITLHMGKSA